jgi:hypothetical protein
MLLMNILSSEQTLSFPTANFDSPEIPMRHGLRNRSLHSPWRPAELGGDVSSAPMALPRTV